MPRYRTDTDADLLGKIRLLEDRLSRLERTPQAGSSSIDSGAFTILGVGGSIVFCAGDDVPAELKTYYNALSQTVVSAALQKKNNLEYTYAALVLDSSGLPVYVEGQVAESSPQESRRMYNDYIFAGGQPTEFFGIAESVRMFIGSVLAPAASQFILQNAFMFIGTDIINPVKHSTQEYGVVAGSNLTLTTALQDVPNCSVTVTTNRPNALVAVHGSFDFEETAIGTTTAIGVCIIDGVQQFGNAQFAVKAVGDLCTPAQSWLSTLVATGSHTIKLQALKSINAGTVRANQFNTSMRVTIKEV